MLHLPIRHVTLLNKEVSTNNFYKFAANLLYFRAFSKTNCSGYFPAITKKIASLSGCRLSIIPKRNHAGSDDSGSKEVSTNN